MDMLISTSDLRFHQSASSVLAFTGSRKLGVIYHFHLPSVYLAAGVYTHNDINKLGDGRRNSHVFTCRGVWRNWSSDRRLFHFGGVEFLFRAGNLCFKGSILPIVLNRLTITAIFCFMGGMSRPVFCCMVNFSVMTVITPFHQGL